MKCSPRCNELAIPDSYSGRAEWMEAKFRTHDQRQCPGCQLWTIWVRRRRSLAKAEVEAVMAGGELS